MTEKLPICENCEFYKKPLFREALCMKFSRYRLENLVSLNSEREKCLSARRDEGQCGESGYEFINKK